MGCATSLWPRLLAVMLFLVLALPATAQTDRQQSVVIKGNQRIEVATILSYMQLKPGQQVGGEELNTAVRRLFDTGLFRDVIITPGQNQLTVEVVENPSINEIGFDGNDALKDEDLLQIIRSRPRLPYTPAAAEADAQAIIEVYRRTGRYGAEVEPKTIERTDNRVDLVFEISEGELTGVSAIDFVGNQAFSERRLRGVISTAETGMLSQFLSTDVYDPDKLELDKEQLRTYYLSEGYADFTVLSAVAELSPDRDGFFLTFTVDEGPQYAFGDFDVSIATTKGLDIEEFRALLPTDLKGETYDAGEVEEIANALTDLAGQRGFAFVQVKPRANKDTENKVIGVTFDLVEGSRIFVERIDIEGNNQTLDRVIRREVKLVEGDAFDARKIRDARADIRRLGYFSSVEVDTEPGSAEDRAVLKVKVKEQSTGSLSLGIGFSTSAGPIGNIAATERNFLGRGQVVSAQVTAAGDTQIYDFNFSEPKFLDRDLLVGFRAFFIDDNRSDTSSFQTQRLGFSPQFGFPLSEDADVRFRYSFLRDDLDVDSGVSQALVEDVGTNYSSTVGYTLAYDQRNDPLEPTAGYLAKLDQDFAGLGGDSRYVKTRGSIKGWQGFFDDQLIASIEIEAGGLVSLGENSRVTDRFFLGGESLRGFADEGVGPRDIGTDDSVGGNYFGAIRLETSFPLGLPEELGIYGGFFVDAGTLFGLDQTRFVDSNGNVTLIDDGASIRVGAGALLFVDTPFGPLKLSFGAPIIREDFDESEFFRLSIGTRF